LRDHDQDPDLMDSLVLIDDGGVHLRSRAALRIAAGLRFPWWLLRVFSWLPTAWLDVLYDAFAARRYAWFGRSENCLIPDEAFKSRFVADE
jgi:predicted DCC family thiol-disulfide oxidoreductase YuxK